MGPPHFFWCKIERLPKHARAARRTAASEVRHPPSAADPVGIGRWWELAAIAIAALVVYLPALGGGILWDDPGHITAPALRSLRGLWRIWFEIGATQQYYPLLHTAFWIEHHLWGDSLFAYHLLNVALHALAACLLLVSLRRLAVPGAFLAALVFTVHPVYVESVAWISEQKNTLSAVFYLAAAIAYLRFDRTRRRSSYAAALVWFVLALLTKTVTATLPAALLLVFWWKRGRLSLRRDVAPLVPWFAAAAAGGLVTAWFERELIGARGPDFALTLVQRTLLAGRVVWFYLSKLVWPADLIFIYPHWTIDSGAPAQYVFVGAALALAALFVMMARRRRGPLAGFLFFCGTLFPVLGFFDVYPFRFSYVADHFQYLASLGVIVPLTAAAALGAGRLTGSSNNLAKFGAAAILMVLGLLTWRQSAMYADAETLYETTVARNPGAWMAYLNLGTELANRQRLEEAVGAYEAALRLRPDYAQARRNLVLAYLRLAAEESARPEGAGRAIAHLHAALALDPRSAEAHYELGNVLAANRMPGAVKEYAAALAIEPNRAEIHLNLGSALADMPGRQPEAVAEYRAALRIRPDYFQAHYNLGTLLLEDPARLPEAAQHLEAAVRLRPDSPEAQLNFGMALAGLPGRRGEAIEHLEFALRRRPDFSAVRETIEELKRLGP